MDLNEFLNFTLSGFFHFIGVFMLMMFVARFVYKMWSRLLRHFTILKHGYPPNNCDAEGEFKFDSNRKAADQRHIER